MFAAAYGVWAQGFPMMGLEEGFGPGLFPTVIATIIFVFAAIDAARQFQAYRRRGRGVAGRHPSAAGRSTLGVTRQEIASASILVAAIVATVLLMPYAGFVVASAGLVLVLTVAMGMRPLWKCAAVSALVAGGLYLVFAEGFGVIFAF